MKKLVYILFIVILSFELSLCSNPKNTSYDKDVTDNTPVSESMGIRGRSTICYDSILSINRRVWDSIGWIDSTSLGIKMPLYKMVEYGEPVSFNELNLIYEYKDSGVWVLNAIHDMPSFYTPGNEIGWAFWRGRESILTRFDDFPITIKCVLWNIGESNSIYMYYKYESVDSLVPIDGFIFDWYEIPWISIEPR